MWYDYGYLHTQSQFENVLSSLRWFTCFFFILLLFFCFVACCCFCRIQLCVECMCLNRCVCWVCVCVSIYTHMWFNQYCLHCSHEIKCVLKFVLLFGLCDKRRRRCRQMMEKICAHCLNSPIYNVY